MLCAPLSARPPQPLTLRLAALEAASQLPHLLPRLSGWEEWEGEARRLESEDPPGFPLPE